MLYYEMLTILGLRYFIFDNSITQSCYLFSMRNLHMQCNYSLSILQEISSYENSINLQIKIIMLHKVIHNLNENYLI